MLEGLFGEYHSSSAVLGQQHPEVTRQPLVRDWLATPETLKIVNRHLQIKREICAGVNKNTVKRLG